MFVYFAPLFTLEKGAKQPAIATLAAVNWKITHKRGLRTVFIHATAGKSGTFFGDLSHIHLGFLNKTQHGGCTVCLPKEASYKESSSERVFSWISGHVHSDCK